MILAVLVTKETVRMTKKNRFCFLCYHTLIITNQSYVLSWDYKETKNLSVSIMKVTAFCNVALCCLQIFMMLCGNNLITFDWRCKRSEVRSQKWHFSSSSSNYSAQCSPSRKTRMTHKRSIAKTVNVISKKNSSGLSLCISKRINWIKVHIFREDHNILRNLHLTFDWHYIGQK